MGDEIGLVVPDFVFRLPRTKLAIDGSRVVARETRWRGDRVARGVSETELIPEGQAVVEVFFKLQRDEIGIQSFEVTIAKAVKRIARHWRGTITMVHQHVVCYGHPRDAV